MLRLAPPPPSSRSCRCTSALKGRQPCAYIFYDNVAAAFDICVMGLTGSPWESKIICAAVLRNLVSYYQHNTWGVALKRDVLLKERLRWTGSHRREKKSTRPKTEIINLLRTKAKAQRLSRGWNKWPLWVSAQKLIVKHNSLKGLCCLLVKGS